MHEMYSSTVVPPVLGICQNIAVSVRPRGSITSARLLDIAGAGGWEWRGIAFSESR